MKPKHCCRRQEITAYEGHYQNGQPGTVGQGEVEGWELREDDKHRLHMRRSWRTKNFVKVEAPIARKQ